MISASNARPNRIPLRLEDDEELDEPETGEARFEAVREDNNIETGIHETKREENHETTSSSSSSSRG